jgi:hypothetical protein
MRRRINRRITDRVQRRPWLEVLETRLTPSSLMGGRDHLLALQPSIQATEAPALGAHLTTSTESAVPAKDHGHSGLGNGLLKHSDQDGVAGKGESQENPIVDRGPAVTLTIQTDEVTVSITRHSSMMLDSESIPNERHEPSAAGRMSGLSSELSNINSFVSVPIIVLFIVNEPSIQLRFIATASTASESQNAQSVSAESNQSPSSVPAELSVGQSLNRAVSALSIASAAVAGATVANTGTPGVGDAALRLFSVAAQALSPDRAFQVSGDNSAAARSLLPGGFNDPSRGPVIATTPPLRFTTGSGGDEEAAKPAQPTPPVQPPIVLPGAEQKPEAIVAAESQGSSDKPEALSTRWARIVAGSIAGAAVVYIALSSYGRDIVRRFKSRHDRTPTLRP